VATGTPHRVYEFGAFRLDEKERVLLRDGRPVPLMPKAFETLLALVEQPGRAIDKGELMQRVWPGVFVEENNLAQNISILRKALGDAPDGVKLIETLPRRGYRLNANVTQSWEPPLERVVIEHIRSSVVIEEEEEQTVVAPRPRRNALAVVLATVVIATAVLLAIVRYRPAPRAAAATPPRNLAILPFRNLKPDAQTDFLGLSLADSIITSLGSVRALIVRPSSYIEKYRHPDADAQAAARELNVDTILTGSFLKDGDDLRITAQLIDVGSSEILWRDTLDVKYDKLLTVQDRVTQQIIQGLRLTISPAETERLKLDPPHNQIAYENFLRGRYLISTNDQQTAIRMLEESVALDPQYALAWAYLGKAYSVTALQYFGGRAFNDKARAAYDRALALNPAQPETHILLANFLTENNRVEEAVPILKRVLEANPNHPFAHWQLSYAYRYAGVLDESIAEGERALRLYPHMTGQLFNSYLYAGRYERFIESLPSRDDAYIVFYRGLGHYYLKDLERAAAFFDRAYELDPTPAVTRIGRAFRLGIAGRNREGLEVLKPVDAEIEKGGASDGEISYKVAQAFATLGDHASALRLLRRSIEQGFFCSPYFTSDPLLKALNAEAAFAELMAQARRRDQAFTNGLGLPVATVP
jgi:DNA-binding winged helix-turn-helix (wHTH) protein/TolB-like protein/tetratricopeptide (TPR) repeat protein